METIIWGYLGSAQRKAPGSVVKTREKVGVCGVGKCWLATGFAIQVYLSGGARWRCTWSYTGGRNRASAVSGNRNPNWASWHVIQWLFSFTCWKRTDTVHETPPAQKSGERLCKTTAPTVTIIKIKVFSYRGLQLIEQSLINRGKETSSISSNNWCRSSAKATPIQSVGRLEISATKWRM